MRTLKTANMKCKYQVWFTNGEPIIITGWLEIRDKKTVIYKSTCDSEILAIIPESVAVFKIAE